MIRKFLHASQGIYIIVELLLFVVVGCFFCFFEICAIFMEK